MYSLLRIVPQEKAAVYHVGVDTCSGRSSEVTETSSPASTIVCQEPRPKPADPQQLELELGLGLDFIRACTCLKHRYTRYQSQVCASISTMAPDRSSRSSHQNFTTLEPRVRNVSEATIRKRWKKLPAGPQDKLKELVVSLKQQARTAKRKAGAGADLEDCVEEIADRLMHRLPRMPFPPSTDEQQFDFEATLQRIGSLEDQLTDNIHSINLLRAQVAQEERSLQEDRRELASLNNNMKSTEALRRRQQKTLHPLAQAVRETQMAVQQTESDDETSNILNNHHPGSKAWMLPEADLDVQPLLKQLRSHLDTIHNNTAGVQPIGAAVTEAQAAIHKYTHGTLRPQQYSRLYGFDQHG